MVNYKKPPLPPEKDGGRGFFSSKLLFDKFVNRCFAVDGHSQ
jgi:hypothetical protein